MGKREYCIQLTCAPLFIVTVQPREDSTKAYTTQVNNAEIAAKKIRWIYPTKEINNKNNDMPKGTEDKVYSAVVSPIISVV
jgi:hypothetical protein